MNWDRVEGNWKQFRGKVKEQWGKLTDDELTQINGNREQLEGNPVQVRLREGQGKAGSRRLVQSSVSLRRTVSITSRGQFVRGIFLRAATQRRWTDALIQSNEILGCSHVLHHSNRGTHVPEGR